MWFFKRVASEGLEIESGAETTPVERDQSKADTYYRLANRVAWALDEDPLPVETLREFVLRKTAHIELNTQEESKALWDATYCSAVIEDEEENRVYYLTRARVFKLGLQLAVAKDHARIRLEARKSGERDRINAQLSAGILKPDTSGILSQAEIDKVLADHQEKARANELARIWGALAANEFFDFNQNVLTEGEVNALRREHELMLVEAERVRLRNHLGLGNPLEDFNLESLSEQEALSILAEEQDERNLWLRKRSRPEALPYGVSHVGAEHLVADWLRYLGHANTEVTQASQDGGVDVMTADYACQVKLYRNQPVSVQEVRELFGVATFLGKKGLFFTSSTLTSAAVDFAELCDIPVIRFKVETGELAGLTSFGDTFLQDGCYESPENLLDVRDWI